MLLDYLAFVVVVGKLWSGVLYPRDFSPLRSLWARDNRPLWQDLARQSISWTTLSHDGKLLVKVEYSSARRDICKWAKTVS